MTILRTPLLKFTTTNMFQIKIADLNVICILRHMHKPLFVRQYTFEKTYKNILRGFRVKDVLRLLPSGHIPEDGYLRH
jgi:hypothetical protein